MASWTCWYWPNHLNDPDTIDAPVPYERRSSDLNDLRAWARDIAANGGISWVKVFRTNDEHDERFRWPEPGRRRPWLSAPSADR